MVSIEVIKAMFVFGKLHSVQKRVAKCQIGFATPLYEPRWYLRWAIYAEASREL